MKNRIIAILGMSPEAYDEMLWQTYWNWCQKYATSENNVQTLIANAYVNRWFLKEYGALEKEFANMIEYFPRKINDPEYHYKGLVVQIFNNYPKPLFESLKLNPEFTFNINPTLKIYGN